MSEPNNMRWRMRVVDLPKPIRSGTAYRFLFIGMGVASGALWEYVMVDWFGPRRGAALVLAGVAFIFGYQAFFLAREGARLRKEEQELRAWANREIGPEVKDETVGMPSHNERDDA